MSKRIKKDSIWINLKNQNVYRVHATVLNATNDQNGQVMILYSLLDDPEALLYVRERAEFLAKFKQEDTPRCICQGFYKPPNCPVHGSNRKIL